MNLPFGALYSTTLSSRAVDVFDCEHCDFCAPVVTFVEDVRGVGFSPLWLNNDGAQERAERSAQRRANRRAHIRRKIARCPDCSLRSTGETRSFWGQTILMMLLAPAAAILAMDWAGGEEMSTYVGVAVVLITVAVALVRSNHWSTPAVRRLRIGEAEELGVDPADPYIFDYGFDAFDEDDDDDDDNDDEFEDEDAPRMHHYLFAHRILPSRVFAEPEFAAALFSPEGSAAVETMWMIAGMEGSIQDGQRISANPELELHSVAGRIIAMITLPLPLMPAEAGFIAVFEDGRHGLRYLVYERTEDERAILCEWFGDDSRCTHQRMGPLNADAFMELLEEHLEYETERADAGLAPATAKRWSPGEDADLDQVLESDEFRAHPCVFAFHMLPIAAAEGGLDDVEEQLEDLWWKAGTRCEQHGQVGSHPPTGLSARRANIATLDCLLINLPKPLAPPEPFMAAVLPTGEGYTVYTLELMRADPRAPAVVCSVTPLLQHVVHGLCDGTDSDDFEIAIARVLTDDSLPTPGGTLEHMMLWAQLAGSVPADN